MTAQPAPEVQEPAETIAIAPAPTITEEQAKWNVYHRESGHDPGAVNPSSGACGIGQALPCSKLPCSLADLTCQDKWFTEYMQQRYGSWAKAWEYWNCIGYCTNRYGTILKENTWW